MKRKLAHHRPPKATAESVRWIARLMVATIFASASAIAAGLPASPEFKKDVRPILENYCSDCHFNGALRGNVAFDGFKTDQAVLEDRELWLRVLKNLRAGLMPPQKQDQPTKEDKELITEWIKQSVFQADPNNPDPGRVTIRRLNRAEYRNTIRDLLGVDFETAEVFPPDDTGNGFDDIGDVLTLPPMLLEKYVVAANQIVTEAVPQSSKVVAEKGIGGWQFHGASGKNENSDGMSLSYYQPAAVSNICHVDFSGKYQLALSLRVNEEYVDGVFDYNKCRCIFRVDGRELLKEEYPWEDGKSFHYHYEMDLTAGDHELAFELQPLTTNEQVRTLSMQISTVKIGGPLAQEYWVQPQDYAKFFPRKIPDDAAGRRAYAR